jgi:hypothetical protein
MKDICKSIFIVFSDRYRDQWELSDFTYASPVETPTIKNQSLSGLPASVGEPRCWGLLSVWNRLTLGCGVIGRRYATFEQLPGFTSCLAAYQIKILTFASNFYHGSVINLVCGVVFKLVSNLILDHHFLHAIGLSQDTNIMKDGWGFKRIRFIFWNVLTRFERCDRFVSCIVKPSC